MDDTYQYPVFFECATLDAELKKKIQKYFNIRRKSGGGDCSSVTHIRDKVYSIAFRQRDGKTCDCKCLLFSPCRLPVDFLSHLAKISCAGESESVPPAL